MLLRDDKHEQAYQMVLQMKEQNSLIKLMVKSGVCNHKLSALSCQELLANIVSMLNDRSFVDVLLPWVSAMVKESGEESGLGLEHWSQLVDCLLGLLRSSQSEGLDYSQKIEVHKIYEALRLRL